MEEALCGPACGLRVHSKDALLGQHPTSPHLLLCLPAAVEVLPKLERILGSPYCTTKPLMQTLDPPPVEEEPQVVPSYGSANHGPEEQEAPHVEAQESHTFQGVPGGEQFVAEAVVDVLLRGPVMFDGGVKEACNVCFLSWRISRHAGSAAVSAAAPHSSIDCPHMVHCCRIAHPSHPRYPFAALLQASNATCLSSVKLLRLPPEPCSQLAVGKSCLTSIGPERALPAHSVLCCRRWRHAHLWAVACITALPGLLCLELRLLRLSNRLGHCPQSNAAAAGGGLSFGSGLGPAVALPHMNGATPRESLYAAQADSTGHLLHHQMPVQTIPHHQVPVCHPLVWHVC